MMKGTTKNTKERETIKILREALIHECDEANVLAEFIGLKGLDNEYSEWSRDKFKKL